MQVGGVPRNMVDLWEVTGKSPESTFTWDLDTNDNLDWEWESKPKCRFDRLYMKPAPDGATVKPVHFELVGLERLPTCRRFCSDHWGILSHLEKL